MRVSFLVVPEHCGSALDQMGASVRISNSFKRVNCSPRENSNKQRTESCAIVFLFPRPTPLPHLHASRLKGDARFSVGSCALVGHTGHFTHFSGDDPGLCDQWQALNSPKTEQRQGLFGTAVM